MLSNAPAIAAKKALNSISFAAFMAKTQAPEIKNRRAGFEYHLLAEYTAGMVLTGTEVKSLRAGKANITEAYALFENDMLLVRNMDIAIYAQGSYNNHEPRRDRVLLLKKAELSKLKNKLKDKGLTLIPLRLWFNDRGYAKLDMALAKGKKLFDKREELKKKDIKRELEKG